MSGNLQLLADTLAQAKTYFLDFDAGTTLEPLSAAELNCTASGASLTPPEAAGGATAVPAPPV